MKYYALIWLSQTLLVLFIPPFSFHLYCLSSPLLIKSPCPMFPVLWSYHPEYFRSCL